MGQTLTHGIYLPEEGERNCYSGLAANWSILDGAVGTIAEHTSALAGKANAVHTHTKADITDFPAYGTTAGTICEGNDSRLSDARTPVAHTHGKADITDLFSSANTWRANNTYSADCTIYNSNSSGSVAGLKLRNSKAEVLSTGNTSSDQSMTFRDKNDVAIGYIRGAVQSSSVAVKIGAYAKDSSNNTVNTELQLLAYTNGNKAVIPSANNSYDLGSSSNQWNKIYSADVVHTSGNETITGVKTLIGYWHLQAKNLKAGEGETYGRTGYSLVYTDKNDVTMGDVTLFKNANAARTFIRIRGGDYYTNGAPAAAGTLVQSALAVGTNVSGKKIIECDSDIVYPTTNNATDLGTSDNRWKSLNGINPGALSLPDYSKADALDVSAQGLNWDLTGATSNSYTPTFDGYLSLRCKDTNGDFLIAAYGGSNAVIRNCAVGTGILPGTAGLCLLIPMLASTPISIRVKATTNFKAYIMPCFGNV